MIDLHLHGSLARLAPGPLRLDVGTPAEAVRACEVLLPGFRRALSKADWQIEVDGERLAGAESLTLRFGAARRCDVRPAPAGAGAETALWIFAAAALASAAYAIVSIPDIADYGEREEADARPSYLFRGGANAVAQGGCVPLVYGGPIRVGSTQVSASLSSERIPIVAPGSVSDADTDVGRRVRFEGRGGRNRSPRTPVEGDNTLQTRATLRAVDLIGEGEMRGLVDGLKSCYVDGVPVQNADGSMNIEGVGLEWRSGTPDQDAIEGIAETSTPVRFSTKVAAAAPVVRTVQRDRDAARVTLRFPRLSTLEDDGDIRGASVRFRIETQATGGAWTTTVEQTISDKSSAPAELSWRVPLAGAAPHSVRVTRLTPDSDSDRLHNDLYWVGLDEIVDVRQSYPHSALVGIVAEADKYEGNVHRREYDVYGLIVDVPSNYNPETRAYAGLWDGTFKRAWTDNGAWCAYDLLRSPRYGLGVDLPAEYLDAAKWEFFAVAQWNDRLVPDGRGGTEPRFRFTGVVQRQQDAKRLLDGVFGAFRSALYYGAGAVVPVQDAPADPVALVGDANVVDGAFRYGDAIGDKRRASAVAVSFNDPADGFKLGIELVVDDDLVARHGWRRRDVAAMYCTRRSQAHRLGLHLLREQERESRTLRYGAGLDHASLRPGDVIRQTDSRRAGTRLAVRLSSNVVIAGRFDAAGRPLAAVEVPGRYVVGGQMAWLVRLQWWGPRGQPRNRVAIQLHSTPDYVASPGPQLTNDAINHLQWRIVQDDGASPWWTIAELRELVPGDRRHVAEPYQGRPPPAVTEWMRGRSMSAQWSVEVVDSSNALRCDALPPYGAGGWTAHVMLADGTVQTTSVTRFDGRSVVLDAVLRDTVVAGAMMVLETASGGSALWRIVSLSERSGLEVVVAARSYDADRYAAVERGWTLDAVASSAVAAMAPPDAVVIRETSVRRGAIVEDGAEIGVTGPNDPRIEACAIELRRLDAADTEWRPVAWGAAWSAHVAPLLGRIQARARFVGVASTVRSPWTESTIVTVTAGAPGAPSGLKTTVTDRGYIVAWDEPRESDYERTEIRDGTSDVVADAAYRGSTHGTQFEVIVP